MLEPCHHSKRIQDSGVPSHAVGHRAASDRDSRPMPDSGRNSITPARSRASNEATTNGPGKPLARDTVAVHAIPVTSRSAVSRIDASTVRRSRFISHQYADYMPSCQRADCGGHGAVAFPTGLVSMSWCMHQLHNRPLPISIIAHFRYCTVQLTRDIHVMALIQGPSDH
jgi:hypothetical protein